MMNALPAHIAVVDPGWTIGHNMVVDGYNTNDYYHINFGWGGSYNGWYLIPNGLPYGLTVVEGVIVDIIPHDHILNLSKFPYYLSQVNSGAMAMKMMLDYLMWNSTTHPQGPPSVYNEQTLYTNYSGGNWINGSEICYGLNAEIDDEHQTPPWSYGYYFAPSANVSATEILKEICVWFDYPIDYYNDVRVVDVPKPGHTNHVPVAVPIYGNYSRWVVIRGIHTDINAWLPPAQLTVYGFWINDPVSGGIGNNTYVTASRFLSTYFRALNVSGDQYNGKFLAVTDPNLEYNQNNIHDMKLSIGETTPAVTLKEVALVRFIENMRTPIRNEEANTIIVKAAFEQIKNILKNDVQGLVSSFEKSNAVGKPLYKDGCWTVQFTNSDTSMTVLLDKDCKLLEFSLT